MRLGVNIDHVATVRQARRGRFPDPVEAALLCERGGAQSIVCHLREDRRHIQDRDVRRLKSAISTQLNLEMSVAPDIVDVACAVRPAQVTLVPERRRELTTEGGLDVCRFSRRLPALVRRFHGRGIAVSLFVDPVAAQLEAARAVGVDTIELHTGGYATARLSARATHVERLRLAAHSARAMGLSVAAGHGLDYENIGAMLEIPEIEEVNIGFAIISRALVTGLEQAVREMAGRLQPAMAHGR